MSKIILNPALKLLYHGSKVEKWLKGEDVIPILVEISPTGYCNADCPFCFFKEKRNENRINKDTMINTLRDMAKAGVTAIAWTGGGEPTIHPNFADFIEEANKAGLKQGLFTNAYQEIPYQEMFEWIRITLTDKEFDVIKKPKVPFGICVNMTKDLYLSRLCEESRLFGASYFQVRPALEGFWQDQPIYRPPIYLKNFETNDFKVYLTPYKFRDANRPRKYNKCYGHNFCPSIDWNGNLGTCLYMMQDPKYVFGDLNKNSFSEVWKNRKIDENLVTFGCQNCCKNHEINKVLFKAKLLDHKDFL